MQLPVAAQSSLTVFAERARDQWGRAIAEIILSPASRDDHATLVNVIRAAATEPRAADLIREFYEAQLVERLADLELTHSDVRATVISSLIAGLTFSSEILGLTAFSQADRRVQTELLAAILQAALTVEVADDTEA